MRRHSNCLPSKRTQTESIRKRAAAGLANVCDAKYINKKEKEKKERIKIKEIGTREEKKRNKKREGLDHLFRNDPARKEKKKVDILCRGEGVA